MGRQVRIKGITRKQIDEDKLALAFLLLAKVLHEQEQEQHDEPDSDIAATDGEAA